MSTATDLRDLLNVTALNAEAGPEYLQVEGSEMSGVLEYDPVRRLQPMQVGIPPRRFERKCRKIFQANVQAKLQNENLTGCTH
jgi:hypothetical protein